MGCVGVQFGSAHRGLLQPQRSAHCKSVYTCASDLWLRPSLPHNPPPPNLLQPGSEVSSCVSHKLAPEKQLEERILFLVQPQAGRHCPSFPHSPSMKTLVSGWGPGVD